MALFLIMKTFLIYEDEPQKIIPLLICEWKCAKLIIHNIFTFIKGNNFLIMKQIELSFFFLNYIIYM